MPEHATPHTAHSPQASVFSPLAKALLDGFSEGVVVFDAAGKVLYANQQAREALATVDASGEMAGTDDSRSLLPRLAAMGGRLRPLRVGNLELGEAMFIPGLEGPSTLAQREKEAIVRTLDANSWKLAETARHLGISRTTLWRRLKAYGLHRDGRSKWAESA
jgi:transcriptional regulator of acetoin/glycerol metabolism